MNAENGTPLPFPARQGDFDAIANGLLHNWICHIVYACILNDKHLVMSGPKETGLCPFRHSPVRQINIGKNAGIARGGMVLLHIYFLIVGNW